MRKAVVHGVIAGILTLLSSLALAAIDNPDPPHDAGRGYSCPTCHTLHSSLSGSSGYNNVCLDCHRPGVPRAGQRPFVMADAADPFGRYTANRPAPLYQSSHRWDGSDTVPAAGAQPPLNAALNKSTFTGKLLCARCHDPHTNTYPPFLRMANDQDQLCLDCHRSRNTTDQAAGTHPVGVDYAAAVAANPTLFQAAPLNANPANPTAALNLVGGKVLCSTCHGVHFSDSNSRTFDNASSAVYNRLSTSRGNLLHTDLRGAKVASGQPDRLNICSSCHAGKKNHNFLSQDVQCADCHAGHVEYDPQATTPAEQIANVYLVRRYMNISTTNGAVRNGRVFLQTTAATRLYRNASGTGVCQACHAIPGNVAAHDPANPNTAAFCNNCHAHDGQFGSFSGGCTACHGYPPTTNTPGGPTGYAVYNSLDYSQQPFAVNESTSPHYRHAGGGTNGYLYSCDECHKGNVNHATGDFQQVFLAPAGTLATTGGASPAYSKSAQSCSSVYCHSDGAGNRKAASWRGLPGSLDCGGCHNKAGDATWSGSAPHLKHVTTYAANPKFTCNACHAATASGNTTISDRARHVNGVKDVALNSTVAGSWNGTTCANVTCHSDGQTPPAFAMPSWSGTTTCANCHGTATAAGAAGTALSGKHPQHVNQAAVLGSNFGCVDCHAKTVSSNATIANFVNHVNGLKDYSGARAGRSAACSAFYCHSNGKGTFVAPPAWTSTAVLGCNGCHGTGNSIGSPDNSTPNSHPQHVGSAGDCVRCHQQTTQTGTAIRAGSTLHVNGASDVRLARVSGFTTFSGVYNPAAKSCFATYCHGGAVTSPAWGQTGVLTCETCHRSNGSGGGLPAGHAIHYATATAPTSYTAAPANLSGGTYVFSCSSCHGTNVSNHANGPVSAVSDATVFFGFSSAGRSPAWVPAATTATGSPDAQGFKFTAGQPGACKATYCHSNGAGGDGLNTTFTWTSAGGGATLGCTGCHGGTAASGTPLSSGRHTAHSNNAAVLGTGNNLGCSECHAKTVSSDSVISNRQLHVNKLKDYSGIRAGRIVVAGQCANSYCHSSGQAAPVFRSMTGGKSWTGNTILGCNGCHGRTNATGAPDYSNGGPASATANTHDKHVAAAGITDTRGCARCHLKTVDAGVAGKLRNYSTLHLNRSREVVFSAAIGGSYNTAAKSCAATTCHGTPAQLPSWGGAPLACTSCHSGSVTSFANPTVTGAHASHWQSDTPPADYAALPANTSTPTQYQFSCASCHRPGSAFAQHANLTNGAPGGTYTIAVAEVFFGFTTAGRNPAYSYGTVVAGTDSGSFRWSAGGAGSCNQTYCHSDGKGGNGTNVSWNSSAGTLGCSDCHGTATSNTLSGAHPSHVNNAAVLGSNFGCVDCHAKTVSGNATISNKSNHVNRLKDYSGAKAGGSASYNPTTKICSAAYCHSDGNPRVASRVFTTPTWTGAALGCDGCHGVGTGSGYPNHAGAGIGTTGSNSHPKHVAGSSIACNECHWNTTQTNTTLVAGGGHLNGSTSTTNDVRFRVGGLNAAGTYSASGQTCATTYCHGTGPSIAWGGVADCASCHDASNALAGRHDRHVNTTAVFPNLTGGNAHTATTYVYGCKNCHPTTTHAQGPVTANVQAAEIATTGQSRLTSYTPGGTSTTDTRGFAYTVAGTCSTACHSDGKGGAPKTAVNWGSTPVTGSTCGICHDNYASASPITPGKHVTHVQVYAANPNFTCGTCHTGTATSNSAINGVAGRNQHPNGITNVQFNAFAGGAFIRGTLAEPLCQNIYCHGDGTTATPTVTLNWNGADFTGQCNDCHSANPQTGSHVPHGNGCQNCHYATLQSFPGIPNYSSHVDKTATLNFTPTMPAGTAAYNGQPAGGASVYRKPVGTAYATCSIYCHSTVQGANGAGVPSSYSAPLWGSGAMTCGSCHVNMATSASATGNHVKHAQTSGIPCASCHDNAFSSISTAPPNHVNFEIRVIGNPTTIASGTNYSKGVSFAPGLGYGTCSTSYCHSNSGPKGTPVVYATTNPTWGGAALTCGSCHKNMATDPTADVAPNATATGSHVQHAQTSGYACAICHSTGGPGSNHTDQKVEMGFTGNAVTTNYSKGSAPAVGGGYGTCTNNRCHGTTATTPSWGGNTARSSCAKCHGVSTSNPFYATNGATATTDAKVGAHTRHLAGLTLASPVNVRCNECHLVPTSANDAGHFDTAGPAETIFGTLARTGSLTPSYNTATGLCTNVYCHGVSLIGGTTTTPTWNVSFLSGTASNDCTKCHGYPPNTTDNIHSGKTPTDCKSCHAHVNAAGTGFDDLTKHINGTIEATGGHAFPNPGSVHRIGLTAGSYGACTGCHATAAGGTYPVSAGVAPNCTGCHLNAATFNSVNAGCWDCHGSSAANGRPNGGSFPNRQGGHTADNAHTSAACSTCHLSTAGNWGTGQPKHGWSNRKRSFNAYSSVKQVIPAWNPGTRGTNTGNCTGFSCSGKTHASDMNWY